MSAGSYSLGDLPPEIRTRIVVNPATGCWEWQFRRRSAKPDYMRYGSVKFRGRHEITHRLVYRLLEGPIPGGLELDHVYARGCRSHACCWPAHLEPVTPEENTRRGKQANIGHGIARTVRRRIFLGALSGRDRDLADAAWMLPFPATCDPEAAPPPVIPGFFERPLYVTEEVSMILGVPVPDLITWRQMDRGPRCFLVGRNWLYDHDQLMAFKKTGDSAA